MLVEDRVSIISYDENQLADLLCSANQRKTPLSYIKTKYHLRFLKEFLGKGVGLNAKFVIQESNYISKDYLSDYSSYYSSCFDCYAKECVRLHFFTFESDDKKEFSKTFYKTIIDGVKKCGQHKKFWDENYIGFIVVKPIPNSILGFSLLKHYNYLPGRLPAHDEMRDFWATRKYKVHVFGNEIELETLAFQEQDKNVAACATIAIWTMLQRAAEDYYVVLKSPNEITLETGLTSHDGNRLIPNEGLTFPLMAQAISKNNLVTELRHVGKNDPGRFNHYVKKLIYAYSNLKIPIILGIKVPDKDGKMVGHAVAVCGHRLESIESLKSKKKSQFRSFLSVNKTKYYDEHITWASERISKMYVHDDQAGPFARLEFSSGNELISQYTRDQDNDSALLANSIAVLACVYPKVRISYDEIEGVILAVDKLINETLKDIFIEQPIWDIRLYFSEEFKNKIQQSELLDDQDESDMKTQIFFLTKNFPKYIWVAKMQIKEDPVIYFIYDATGLSKSNLLHTILSYYPLITDQLIEYLETTNKAVDSLLNYHLNAYIEKLKEFRFS